MYDSFIDFLDWFELHPGLAIWLQGLVILVALGVAMLVPYRLAKAQQAREARDRALEAQGLAVVVHPALVAFDEIIGTAVDTAIKLEELAIEPPRVIAEHIPALWRLGPAGGLVLKAIASLDAHKHQIAKTLRLSLSKDEYDRFFNIARDRLKVLRSAVTDARDQVERLLDLPESGEVNRRR